MVLKNSRKFFKFLFLSCFNLNMSAPNDKTPSGDGPSENEKTEENKGSTDDYMANLLKSLNVAASGAASEQEQRLSSLDLEGVVNFIREGKAKSIITMAGAGISTAAGIPDFRSPGTGLYDRLKDYDLPEPMAVFSIDYFRENPEPFFKVAQGLYPENFKPTVTHYMLKLLHDKGLLLRHYTQNIDMLEEKAGIPAEKMVYAHGNFQTSHCIECHKDYTLEWMRDFVLQGKVPKCENKDCEGTVKPDIVFFGENLPSRFIEKVTTDFKEADLLIIIGTSLVVMPFASLVDRVKDEVPRMYINKELGNTEGNWMLALMGIKQGLRCGQEDNYRDVFAEGDCDDVCTKMADLLGWKDALMKLYKDGHEEKTTPTQQKKSPSGAQAKSSKR